jgi:hypothetical protein
LKKASTTLQGNAGLTAAAKTLVGNPGDAGALATVEAALESSSDKTWISDDAKRLNTLGYTSGLFEKAIDIHEDFGYDGPEIDVTGMKSPSDFTKGMDKHAMQMTCWLAINRGNAICTCDDLAVKAAYYS